MGTETMIRMAPAMSSQELGSWFRDTVGEMRHSRGNEAYSGTWATCEGLSILKQPGVINEARARVLLEGAAYKRGPVVALQVGDFSKVFPCTAADKAMVAKLAVLRNEKKFFEWNILDRSQKAKTKTKKCGKCESSINVHKMEKPATTELDRADTNSFGMPYMVLERGMYLLTGLRGFTDCPVCNSNLLKTDTDLKNEKSLKEREAALSIKVSTAKAAAAAKASKDKPFWLLHGECAS